MKSNGQDPLVVITLDLFLELIKVIVACKIADHRLSVAQNIVILNYGTMNEDKLNPLILTEQNTRVYWVFLLMP